MAAVAVFGNFSPDSGFHNYTADGGFMPNGIWGTWAGVILMAAILLTTAFTDSSFNMTLVFGIPFLAIISIWYWVRVRPRKLAESAAEAAAEKAATENPEP